MPGIAPRQGGERDGGRRIEGNGNALAHSDLQQGAAMVRQDLGNQFRKSLVVRTGARRQVKGEHPTVIEVQPQVPPLIAQTQPVTPQPEARAHPGREARGRPSWYDGTGMGKLAVKSVDVRAPTSHSGSVPP